MKKIVRRLVLLCVIILINVFFMNAENTDTVLAKLVLSMQTEVEREVQLFTSADGVFDEAQSQTLKCEAGEVQELVFAMPGSTKYIRFDLGTDLGEVLIAQMVIEQKSMSIDLLDECPEGLVTMNMVECSFENSGVKVLCSGNDPYLVYDITPIELAEKLELYAAKDNLIKRIALCVAFDFVCIICFLLRRKIAAFSGDIMGNRGLLLDLAKNDFKTKYAGSYLGIVWAFVQPIVTILVYWFVFQVGFRSGVIDGAPFVLWLTAGLVPWFFFNEALNSATGSLLDYSYLVKKVVFNVGIIPPMRIVSALFVHVFFCGFMLVMFMLNGMYPCLEWLQLPYYSLCLVLLILGITYLTSALVVFFRDLAQIIMVVLQVGMWMTPIMWNRDMLSGGLQLIFKLNPLYYIVQGYRDSVIYHRWFWESEFETIFFWLFTLTCICIGNRVFNKLKVHFADVI